MTQHSRGERAVLEPVLCWDGDVWVSDSADPPIGHSVTHQTGPDPAASLNLSIAISSLF